MQPPFIHRPIVRRIAAAVGVLIFVAAAWAAIVRSNRSTLSERYLTQALEHHERGETAEAEAVYKEVLKVDSRNPIALYNLAGLFADRGDLKNAIALLEILLRADPTNEKARAHVQNMKKLQKEQPQNNWRELSPEEVKKLMN